MHIANQSSNLITRLMSKYLFSLNIYVKFRFSFLHAVIHIRNGRNAVREFLTLQILEFTVDTSHLNGVNFLIVELRSL